MSLETHCCWEPEGTPSISEGLLREPNRSYRVTAYDCRTGTVSGDIHHRLFDILLVIVAAWCVVIAVHNLYPDVAFGEPSAPFT